MRRIALALLLTTGGLSCLPTEFCACQPGVYSFRVYGQLPALGTAGHRENVRVRESAAAACGVAPSATLHTELFTVPTSGAYRADLISGHSRRDRCLTLTFYTGTPGMSDSTQIVTAPVRFNSGHLPQDSLEVVPP
jgi:hypothetical protein